MCAPVHAKSINRNKIFIFFKDTAARLSYQKTADVQIYNIPVTVKDRAGQSATKTLRVNLCDCTHPSQCLARSRSAGATLGKWAILAILLGIALLFCKYFHSLKVRMRTERPVYQKGSWEVNIKNQPSAVESFYRLPLFSVAAEFCLSSRYMREHNRLHAWTQLLKKSLAYFFLLPFFHV